MPTKQKSGKRNELIRCNNCGEEYSVTYKRCPFCDESAARNANGRSGKRLNNTRGGGYGSGWTLARIVTTALSLGLIVAAIGIVVTVVKPLIDRGSSEPGTVVVTDSPAADTSAPDQTDEPGAEESAAVQTAESFALTAEDITLQSPGETYRLKATFAPEGTTGNITWTSSDPTIVTVAADGTVTALANGSSTVTAAMDGGYTQTCIVRCSWSGGATATPAASISLNRTDITLRSKGETFNLKVSGTGSTPVWAIGDTSVATISGSGTVTAVKGGMTTVTVKVDGQTLKCIVRCNF